MNKFLFFFSSFLIIGFSSFSQKEGRIIGNIQDKNTLEALMGVNLLVEETSLGTTTDDTGRFNLILPVGTYSITASFLGYRTSTLYSIEVTSGNDRIINFEMEPESEVLEGVIISFNRNASAKTTDMVTPLSVQQLTSQEIQSGRQF